MKCKLILWYITEDAMKMIQIEENNKFAGITDQPPTDLGYRFPERKTTSAAVFFTTSGKIPNLFILSVQSIMKILIRQINELITIKFNK